MNKKILKIGCSGVLGVGVFAGGTVYYEKAHKPMDEKQQIEFTNLVANQVATGIPLDKLQDEVNKNINKLDKENASKVINTYIFDLYQLNSQYITVLNDIKPMMDSISQEKKIDLTKKENVNKLNNGIVKGFLQELENSHLVLKSDAGNYYISVNMQYILDTYSKNLSTDLIDFIKFRIDEDKTQIFNSDTQTFNLDEVAKRITEIEKSEKKYEKSTYLPQWKSTKQYYYNIMFQVNHQFFVNKDGKMKDEIMNDYAKYIKDYSGTELSKNLSKIYDILKADNNSISSKYIEETNNIMNDTFKKDNSNKKEDSNKNVSDDKKVSDDKTNNK